MDSLLPSLAEQGVLGLLLALSIIANVYQYKKYNTLQDNRIDDLKESRDNFLEPIKMLQQTTNLILSILQNGGKKDVN